MAAQPLSIDTERRGGGTPNSEILGPEVLKLPPSLDDIDGDASRGFPMLSDLLDDVERRIFPAAWDNAKFLSDLRWLRQLNGCLPPPSSDDHSVYLVTAPRGMVRYRFRHWSMYSQGHFYHLTAARSDASHYTEAKSGETSLSQLDQNIPVALKVQNVLYPEHPDFVSSSQKTQKKALQAYQVGYTRFNTEQINRLATYVVKRAEGYNIFEENCQLFALDIVSRTVMARRNCSIFVGDMHQLAEWDSTGASGSDTFYSRNTGYVLADAREDYTERRKLSEMMWKTSWKSLRTARRAQAIAILYRDGEQAFGAFDPSGEREGLGYILHRFHHDMWSPTSRETWEDLRNRRWRDACYGRTATRQSRYMYHETMASNGDKITKSLLPLHRWCLRVTAEERLAWAAEPAEGVEADEIAQTQAVS